MENYNLNQNLNKTSRKTIVEIISFHMYHFKLSCGPKEFSAIADKIINLFPSEIKVLRFIKHITKMFQ